MHRMSLIKSPRRGLITIWITGGRLLDRSSQTWFLFHSFFFVWINNKFFDIFGEHGQALVFLGVYCTTGKFNVLRVYYHRWLTNCFWTHTLGSPWRHLLRIVQPIAWPSFWLKRVDVWLFCETKGVAWTENFVILRANFTPLISQNFFSWQTSIWIFLEDFVEEAASRCRHMIGKL